jgi:fructoselysine 6-kinase
MEQFRVIAIGDNVCDKYLSRGRMYPGGQCVNTCVYAKMNGAESAYIGKYGNDEVAECVRRTLKNIGIDDSHNG